jgi:protein required for attachment to host cells
MKAARTWIVVADGAKVRVLAGLGRGSNFKPVNDLSFAEHSPASRDIVSERPGRTFNSTGRLRHAIEPRVDAHEQREAEFLQSVADRLDSALRQKNYDDLIIAAPPRALGILRKQLSDDVRRHLRGELDRDLTKQPDGAIVKLAMEKLLEPGG